MTPTPPDRAAPPVRRLRAHFTEPRWISDAYQGSDAGVALPEGAEIVAILPAHRNTERPDPEIDRTEEIVAEWAIFYVVTEEVAP